MRHPGHSVLIHEYFLVFHGALLFEIVYKSRESRYLGLSLTLVLDALRALDLIRTIAIRVVLLERQLHVGIVAVIQVGSELILFV